MTKSERIKAARERLHAAQQARAEHVVATAKREADNAAAQKKLDRMSHPVLFRRDKDEGTPELHDAQDLRPAYWAGGDKPTEKLLRESIAAGTTKVEFSRYGGSSIQRGAKAMAKGLRVMLRADVSKLRSLDRRIEKLRDERLALLSASYDRGGTLALEDVANWAAKVYFVRRGIKRPKYGSGDEDWELKRADTAIAEAETHLRYATGAMPEQEADPQVCPCNDCHWERRRAADAAAEEARRAALPTTMVDCVGCGKRHKVHVDRVKNVRLTIDDEGNTAHIDSAPVFRCGGKLYVVKKIWEAETAAAAKAQAKLLREQGITWLCPVCEGEHTTLIESTYYSGDANWRYVECVDSESTFPISEVRITKNKKRAELPAQEDEAA